MKKQTPSLSLPTLSSPSKRATLQRAALAWALVAGLGASGLAVAAPTKAKPAVVLIMGDSLSAEYGLPRGSGWVALMQQRLKDKPTVRVVNASISGETTSGGATRLPALLKQHQPTHVVLELGANDALRGLPLASTKANLDQMAAQSRAMGAQVVVVGMMLPPNFGQRYGATFAEVFPAVAKAHQAALVPFLLQGVADRADARDWFQADGIHPQAKAHPIILDNVWKALSPLL